MTPDDWGRINDIFHRVVAEPSGRRDAVLDEACAGDAALRAEVASLLAAHERGASFLEEPAAGSGALAETALAAPDALIGRLVGHYVVLRKLGEGGMGVVYLAEDTRLGRIVALKALAPVHTMDPGRRERLRREARAAAALSHPGIATVYALEELGDHLYIACEYVPGETLRQELARGPLPASRAIDTAIAIGEALSAAHDRGLVHRDLKPENIIRGANGGLKILDFGLARMSEGAPSHPRLTETGAVIGTPAYMAPEQLRGQPVDARADIFALGIVIYELVAGSHPFAGPDLASTIARILDTAPPRLEVRDLRLEGGHGTVEALDAIISMCLQKAPDARFRTVRALVEALERARRGVTTVALPAAGRSAGRADPRWWWQFHQAATSVAYFALVIPLWTLREWAPDTGSTLRLIGGLAAALAAATLRGHLWFTVRTYPSEWRAQRRRAAPWLLAADAGFVLVLILAAMAVLGDHARFAMALVAAAVATLLSFAIIEPATTRAAFGPD